MGNLGRKGDVYVARLRDRGKESKKSLKTTSLDDARAAMLGAEQAVHRRLTGLTQVPPGVDPGDSSPAVAPSSRPPRAGGTSLRSPS